MTTLKFANTHNMVAFLSKPTEGDGFEQIVDFLDAYAIRYALTINPTIYISCIEQFWSTVVPKLSMGKHNYMPYSLGTTSVGGPRCQETIRDTAARTRVLDLEKTKTTQANEIASLKRRVKKLEKKNKSRTYKLKRLYKLGLTARVESSRDEESLDDADKEMFDVDALNGEEVFVAGQNENVVKEVVDAAQVSTAAKTVTITTKEITLAQALEALKTSKFKVKGIVFQEPKANIALIETWDDIHAKIDVDHQLAVTLQAQEQEDLSIEEKNMEGYKLNDLKLKNFDSIQEMFDRAFKRVNTFEDFRTELVEGKEKRAGTELEQEITKKQKVEDDKETTELKHHMLKSFDMEDLETLYKLVKAKYGSTRPVKDLDLILWGDLKTMMQHAYIYMLVEKKYPLAPLTLTKMLEKKLMIDYESEMAYQVLKSIVK
ncbi:hypothetical protein Tco_1541155 [Tanacetum coccineum]